MATRSGIPVENITSIAGVDITAISNICGITTTSIPGWPTGGGASCTAVYFKYGPTPGVACSATATEYQFDAVNEKIYNSTCGDPNDYAYPGMYVNGDGAIYWWHEVSRGQYILEYVGECG
jgi:hypothetical protein